MSTLVPTRLLSRLGLGVLVLGMAVGAGGCVFAAPTWKGPPSDHFDGRRFFNLEPREQRMGFMDWMRTRRPGPWKDWHDVPHGPPPPERVGRGALRVTFINHATVLLQLDGLNILTDPIYSERCSPVSFAGPKRVRPPGIRFEDLPPIDAVVLSHNHYDHMDVATLRRLQEKFPAMRLFAGLGNGALLEGEGLRHVTEVDWWKEFPLTPEVTLVSARTQHFTNRGMTDGGGTLWTGYVFRGPHGATYFAGDTGWGRQFAEARERYGPMRLAVLPIGAYKPEGFMSPVHISPREAVQASVDLGARHSVPMHYGTFRLADDGETEPLWDLAGALVERGAEAPKWWVLGFGEGRDVPP
ncbi:Outer membrane protein romA [Cystobacter fuscus DSM 2262]|uniref:Outer membrane protein romA n=1 Tax=Cystobacter fuscus (strain ATCC 25194 / DSM 2262 / NBRC 100088 / M29) TaxID=1242864 RepID=S9QIS8_CYSF2|nr:MBL fold metallo-hydrolase [Cystobacter fuscus]EPX61159.1 Outer membrane protein romA [Cystobacter fuscus DSM 2262]